MEKEVAKLNSLYNQQIRCSHCGEYFICKDRIETHQSHFCDKCRKKHRGKEIIENE